MTTPATWISGGGVGAADLELPLRAGLTGQRPSPGQGVGAGLDLLRWPAFDRQPTSRPVHRTRFGQDSLGHIDPDLWLVHDSVVDALEVTVPPAKALLQEADRRAWHSLLRVVMSPRAYQALAGAGVAFEEPQDRVLVSVRPAAHHVNRAGDCGEVLTDRSLFPERVAALVRDPCLDERPRVLHAVQPGLAPSLADDSRIRRKGVVTEHHRCP